MRRYREAGKFPNAYKDSDKQWRVPVEDLLASGLTLSGQAQSEHVSAPSEQASEQGVNMPRGQGEQAMTAAGVLVDRVRELEAALAVERARAEGLERVAAAAEANATDLRMALRMIEAARPEQSERAHAEQVSMPTGQGVSRPTGQGERAFFERPGADPTAGQDNRPRRRWWQWGAGP